MLKIDKKQELAEPLLQVPNRFEESDSQMKFLGFYIIFAERLYDLQYATGYTNIEELKYMAEETLVVDVELAKKYLEYRIADVLEAAAHRALKICEEKEKT